MPDRCTLIIFYNVAEGKRGLSPINNSNAYFKLLFRLHFLILRLNRKLWQNWMPTAP